MGRNGCSFAHLLFADKSLLFFKKDNESLLNLQNTLQWYCSLSRQSINLTKSDLFYSPNMPSEEQSTLARLLQVNLVQTPSKYLGLDFKLRGKRVVDFKFLEDKLLSKLQGWKARWLSQAGWGILIKSVLQSIPMYTFSYFKVPNTTCKNLDTIVRNFWWGHDQEVKNCIWFHWDKLCENRKEGGIGFRKFNLMNQAMLAKQFWRISHNPQSLMARTLKAKYFPRCSIHECVPKPHHSWFWRSIVKQDNTKLKEGRWWVGNGWDIPFQHPIWFQCPTQNLLNPNLVSGTVADLIDHTAGIWKADLVRSIYTGPQCSNILRIPLSKTGAVADKVLWKHSTSREFVVKNAYKMLLKDEALKSPGHLRPPLIPCEVWNLIWNVKVPYKVNLFIWRILQDSIPTFLTLKNKGIGTNSTCPLCNEDDESTSHIFLHCTFARAC